MVEPTTYKNNMNPKMAADRIKAGRPKTIAAMDIFRFASLALSDRKPRTVPASGRSALSGDEPRRAPPLLADGGRHASCVFPEVGFGTPAAQRWKVNELQPDPSYLPPCTLANTSILSD